MPGTRRPFGWTIQVDPHPVAIVAIRDDGD